MEIHMGLNYGARLTMRSLRALLWAAILLTARQKSSFPDHDKLPASRERNDKERHERSYYVE